MKVGSLVVFILPVKVKNIKGIIVPKPAPMVYTVRELLFSGQIKGKVGISEDGLYVEEITNTPDILKDGSVGIEKYYNIVHWREVLPPGHIAEINELVAPKEQELELL